MAIFVVQPNSSHSLGPISVTNTNAIPIDVLVKVQIAPGGNVAQQAANNIAPGASVNVTVTGIIAPSTPEGANIMLEIDAKPQGAADFTAANGGVIAYGPADIGDVIVGSLQVAVGFAGANWS